MPRNLDERVEALELNIEGLLKLLGDGRDDRERFWEILKGITTPAVFELADSALVAASRQIEVAQLSLAAVHGAAIKSQGESEEA
jgi:hypothetical protein